MTARRVLVTGASGFTGRYVCEAFSRAGFNVDRWVTSKESDGFHIDMRDAGAVASAIAVAPPDMVVHLAAISFVAHADVSEIYTTNIVATRNLLAALAGAPTRPSRVLLASSANVYGNTEGSVGESELLSPQNDYAVSKMAMESMARLWVEYFPIFITRPFNYTGVGQAERFLIPKIVAHFQERKKEIELGNIDVFRDFGDVRDVADIYLKLATSAEGHWNIVNICTGVATSVREIIGMLEQLSGHRIEVKQNPVFMRKNEIRMLTGDPTNLREMLGDPKRFSLMETLAWMLSSRT
ncbi:NAD-dependent epimerase/dehydratase family protein [Pseudoxanthomonas dokdonensis]|uniref:NAD-dependent epimerase/dehydratase domain-containing protein n=1 Tax=Pseudoxanthomonas dokdonensis TaxID=344882 RepID=A0A0R0CIG7_9GAMM|nr:NAD-dependent epimerase/dehydratase family protein [Pseudoxanthomonas dokdonensis]KRG69615.1 hypothetical protein ABB29_09090 [Pseudoxanthomonas dokdonensis]